MTKTYTFYSSNGGAEIEFELEEKQDGRWELSRGDYSHIFKTRLEAVCYMQGYMCGVEQYSNDERH